MPALFCKPAWCPNFGYGLGQAACQARRHSIASAWSNDDVVMEFYHHISGPYEFVQQTTRHWASGGLDPIKNWGGDRSPPRERT
jgi:hypothetical protein